MDVSRTRTTNGAVAASGAAPAAASGMRRKRVLDDFEPHALLHTGAGGGGRSDGQFASDHHRRSSFHGMPTDFYSDVHSGFQANNLAKSRRLATAELVLHDDAHAALLGSLPRDALAPLVAASGPPPPPLGGASFAMMGEPMQTNNNGLNLFHVPSASMSTSSSCFSTTQLENFRLDSVSGKVEQKETKARVTKPVAKRNLHGVPHSTPRMQPPQLPALSQFLPSKDSPTMAPQRNSMFASGFRNPSAVSSSHNNAKPFASWRMQSSSLAKVDVLSTPPVGPATPAGCATAAAAAVEPAITSEVGIAFGADSDQCSSDEEFNMDSQISFSQDKLNNLSVHDIADDLLEDGPADASATQSQVVMELTPAFVGALSEQEVKGLKEIGAFTVRLLTNTDPIVLGRDHFFPVFGDKIRGCETFHLSRKHCVFHVTRANSKESSKQYKVVVENTSTNGLEVNGRSMKNKEQRELHVGDTVTLLKIRNQGVDTSLAYTLLVKTENVASSKEKPANGWSTPVSRRSSPRMNRNRANSKLHVARKPRTVSNTNPFALPLSPPRKKLKFPKLNVEILIAEPFIAVSESPRQQSRGFRDELSATMAAFASVERLKVSYEYATKETLLSAVQNHTKILIYAGGSEPNRLLIEDQAGMPSFLDGKDLSAAVADDVGKNQLIIVFAKSVATAQVFVDAGFHQVIFVNSSAPCRPKSACYLKALLASLLQGASVEDGHAVARRTALGVSMEKPAANSCLCGIFPGGRSHDVAVGDFRNKPEETNLSMLNALLIPSLPTYFIPQEEVIGEVIGTLRKANVQVCTLRGGAGIGKTSTAVYVAKYATDRRWYKGGVHYVNVESAFLDGKDKNQQHMGSLGWADDMVETDEHRQRITRRVQHEIDELLQVLHHHEPPTTTTTNDSDPIRKTTLVVLDGCDRMNAVQFRDYIVKTVQAYPNVQILLTMRQQMKINLHTKVVEEDSIQMKELSARDSAAVFLSMAKICLDAQRMKQVLPSDTLDTIATHSALCRLKGNPLLISILALELRTNSLDELK